MPSELVLLPLPGNPAATDYCFQSVWLDVVVNLTRMNCDVVQPAGFEFCQSPRGGAAGIAAGQPAVIAEAFGKCSLANAYSRRTGSIRSQMVMVRVRETAEELIGIVVVVATAMLYVLVAE